MSEDLPELANEISMKDTSSMDTPEFDAGDTEASMEDILASIRELIAEDETESVLVLNADNELAIEDDNGFGLAVEPSRDENSDHIFSNIVDEPQDDNALQISALTEDLVSDPVSEEPQTEITSIEALEDLVAEDLVTQNVEDEADIKELLNFVDDQTEATDEFEDLTPNQTLNDTSPIATASESDLEQIEALAEPSNLDIEIVDFEDDLIIPPIPSISTTAPEAAENSAETIEADQEELRVLSTLTNLNDAAEPDISTPDDQAQKDEQETALDQLADTAVASLQGSVLQTRPDNAAVADVDLDGLAQTTDFDEKLDLVFDKDSSDFMTEDTVEAIAETEIPETALEDNHDIESNMEETPSEEMTLRASPDEDIDLVKSLLADLLDEPQAEPDGDTTSNEFNTDEPMVDFVTGEIINTELSGGEPSAEEEPTKVEAPVSVLDTVIQQSIEDEIAVHEALQQIEQEAVIISSDLDPVVGAVAETKTETVEVEVVTSQANLEVKSLDDLKRAEPVLDPAFEPEQNTAEIPTETSIETIVETSENDQITNTTDKIDDGKIDDDVVVLPSVDFGKTFALAAGAATAATALGVAAAVSTDNQDVEEQNVGEGEDTVSEIETIVQTTQTHSLSSDLEIPVSTPSAPVSPETKTENVSPETQEENIMANTANSLTPSAPSLVAEETQHESASAFASLSQAVKEKNELEQSGPPIGDLVQDALRPMLKEWLDKNLKTIVERAVTKEVKRISSGK